MRGIDGARLIQSDPIVGQIPRCISVSLSRSWSNNFKSETGRSLESAGISGMTAVFFRYL